MATRALTPIKVRFILTCIVILIFAIQGGVIFFAISTLKDTAPEVSKALGEKKQNTNTLDDLKRVEQRLIELDDTVSKTNKIVAESTKYRYQDQVINDITRYARQSDIVVQGYTFTTASDSASTSAGQPTPTPPATAGAPGANPSAAPTKPTGVTATAVTISFEGEVDYIKFLQFVRRIEKNLTKMQIRELQLSQPTDDNGKISVPSITVEVYIRNE